LSVKGSNDRASLAVLNYPRYQACFRTFTPHAVLSSSPPPWGHVELAPAQSRSLGKLGNMGYRKK